MLRVGRDVERDANSRAESGAGVKRKALPCPDELDRPPAQVFLQVVEQELEGAVAPDHARQDFSGHRLRRGEQHRLDPGLPFAPAQFRRQVGELAVEVGFGLGFRAMVSEPVEPEGWAAGELARGA